MKKTLLTTVLAAILFTTGFKVINANASTISTYVYQFKQTGKHVKLTSSKHIQTSKHLTKGKEINYYGAKYYYSKQVNGYLLGTDFNHKKTEKAKVTKHKSNNDTNSNSGSNNSNQSDVIKNGFDETTNNVVDRDEYTNVFKTQMLNNINSYRQQHGLSALTYNDEMQSVADQRAQQVSQSLSHYDASGKALASTLAYQKGLYNSYDAADSVISENIANGVDSSFFENPIDEANDMMTGWTEEQSYNGGHYLNLMSPNNKTIAFSLYIGPSNGKDTKVGYAEEYTY